MTEKKEHYFLDPGTQILYVPNHAEGDEDHPDVEAGFVTSCKPHLGIVFCRYWSGPGILRTKANSEGTPSSNIVVKDTVPQEVVDAKLAGILREQATWEARKPS